MIATFHGRRYTAQRVPDVERASFDAHLNSGAGCIALAAHLGARKIIMLGYDCQHTGGRAHWHGDHPPQLGNARSVGRWLESFARLAESLTCEVVNATRETALTCWPRVDLEQALT